MIVQGHWRSHGRRSWLGCRVVSSCSLSTSSSSLFSEAFDLALCQNLKGMTLKRPLDPPQWPWQVYWRCVLSYLALILVYLSELCETADQLLDILNVCVCHSAFLQETEEIITMVGMSARNKMQEMSKLEFTVDLCPALEKLHDFIRHMQGSF